MTLLEKKKFLEGMNNPQIPKQDVSIDPQDERTDSERMIEGWQAGGYSALNSTLM
jgi:hypothetical protein